MARFTRSHGVIFVAALLAACSSKGTTGAGGKTATTTGAGAGMSTSSTASGAGGQAAASSVLQYHYSANRNGVTVDPAFTAAGAAGLHVDSGFHATIQGAVYAQPLFIDGQGKAKDIVLVVTEKNWVYGLDAATGLSVWAVQVGTPMPNGGSGVGCGNIFPLGITGTPVVDLGTRTMFFDAMTTPDNGKTAEHKVFALSIDDGTARAGWPIDANSSFKSGSISFDSSVQGERGALTLLNGELYVPYGGYYGDCGTYYGWVVGISLQDPTKMHAITTRARGGGIWAVGGPSTDGTSLFAATGNTFGATSFGDGDAVLRLAPGPTYTTQNADFFAPTNWMALDAGDIDLGGSAPLVVDAPGSTPSALVVALGKDGNIYVMDRSNLGGVSKGLAQKHVASNEIINGASAYTTSKGTYVVFKGNGVGCPNGTSGNLTSVLLGSGAPAPTVAWCANQSGNGSPMVTETATGQGAIVWSLGSEGDNHLHGFDGDTGAEVFNGGGTALQGLRRFATPIAAKGRIYAAGTDAVYAFTTQ